jgi:HAD superfamily hydrolase (TIGR01450 family)
MQAVILAAGIGSRLRPLTEKKPKGMVKVNGIPIIEHQIKAYLQAGLKESDIIIVAGYKPDFITQFISENYPGINLIINDVYNTTNNMYSLDMALDTVDEDVVVSNGDCVYEYSIISDFLKFSSANSIASEKGSFTDENMKITVNSENRIVHISKQIKSEEAYGNSIDLYKISSESLETFKAIIKGMIEEDKNLWAELALDKSFEKLTFIPFDIEGRKWMEIDNYEDLHIAERKFADFNLSSKKCLIIDGDGTVYVGKDPVPATVDFIIKNQKNYDCYFMTNNTSRDLKGYVTKLAGYGIEIPEEKILSPLLPLIDHLKENNIYNIYPVGNTVFCEYLKKNIPELNFTDDKTECDAVILGYDTELTYEKLKTASLLLHNKEIKYFATHTDVVCPTENGYIPDIGSMITLFEKATNRTPELIFGKPNPLLLKSIEAKYKKEEILIIGDRLYTDKAFADNAGIDFALVLSGETNREDIEDEIKFPRIILNDMGELIQ